VEKIRSAAPQYDVVFMDHMMPHMDGLEATRIIRQEIGTEYAKKVPVIALTANAIVGNENMFLQNGFNGFISKPIDLMRMDTVLNKWIRDKQSPETLRAAAREKAERLAVAGPSPLSRVPDNVRLAAGIDWETGVERCGGEDAYLQILRSYARHTPELLEKMRDLREENLAEYAVTVHGLRGSSYSIYAGEIAGRAEALELAAKAGDFAAVREGNPSFLDAVDVFLTDLGGLLAAVPERGKEKPLKTAPDNAQLKKLLEACRQFGTTGMEESMAELERFRYEFDGELIVWLREQLDSLEYEAIQKRLENLQNCGTE
jgi:HPt (histidine-containing phosphotransfer) domain-containing protein